MSELTSIRGKFTRAQLSEKLREICNDCSEREATDFCTKVDFKDDKVSVQDVIVTLRALVLAANGPETGVSEHKEGEANGETAAAGKDDPKQQSDTKIEQAAEDSILPLKATPIGDDFHKLVKLFNANPAAFEKPFKKDELPQWMREHMPNMDAAATEKLLTSPEVVAGFAGGDSIPSELFLDRLRMEAVALVGPDDGTPHEEEAKAEPKKAEDSNPFSFFCCGGSSSGVHDPSSKPTDVDAKADDKASDAKEGGVDEKADDKGADEKASDTKSVEGASRRARGMDSELDEKAGRSEGSDNGSKRSGRADEEDAKPVRTPGSRTSSIRSMPPAEDSEKKRFSSPKLPKFGSIRNMMSPSEPKDVKPPIVY